MSATLTTSKRLTTQQRVNGATAQLQSLIGASDVKLLSAAITEAAAAEAVHNPAFRRTVQRIYEELSAKSTQSATSIHGPPLMPSWYLSLVPKVPASIHSHRSIHMHWSSSMDLRNSGLL